MVHFLHRVCFATAAFVTLCASAAPAGAPQQPVNLLALSDDTLLIEALYKHPKRLLDGVATSGAVTVNAKFESGEVKEWFIEQQRGGADWIQAGVVLKDKKLIDDGIQVLDWGFAQQGPQGDFPGTGDPLHSTSFFVEAAARAALLLGYSQLPEYQAQVKEWTPKIKAAARWMILPEVASKGRNTNLVPYTHRYYLRAAALGEAAVVTGDRDLAKAALEYAREGLAQQQSDGINPEKGGFDVSYQSVGVAFALRYFTVCDRTSMGEKIKAMSRKALENALPKVGADGSISLEGSSRSGSEVGRSGTVKTVDRKALLQGLVFGSRILSEPRYRQVAETISAGLK